MSSLLHLEPCSSIRRSVRRSPRVKHHPIFHFLNSSIYHPIKHDLFVFHHLELKYHNFILNYVFADKHDIGYDFINELVLLDNSCVQYQHQHGNGNRFEYRCRFA